MNRIAGLILFFSLSIPAGAASISDMSNSIEATPQCLQWKVVSVCICPGTPPYVCGLIVNHYLPVAIVEVIKGPLDSAWGGGGDEKTGVVNMSSDDGVYRGMEVRIWEITDYLRSIALIGVNCALCKNIDAELQSGNQTDGNQDSSILDSACGAGGTMNEIVDRIVNQSLSEANPYVRLVYTTQADEFNWRNGCRDMAKAAKHSLTCIANEATSAVDGLTFDQTDLNSLVDGGDVCIGTWQALYPRQFKAIGISEPVAAGVAAYRAAHIAAKTLDQFRFEVSNKILLQQVLPERKECINPGIDIADAEDQITIADDGRYLFIWWVNVTCCKRWEDFEDDCFESSD